MVGSSTLDSAARATRSRQPQRRGRNAGVIGNSTTTAGNVYVANGGTSSGVAGGGNGTLNIKDNAVLNSNGSFFWGTKPATPARSTNPGARSTRPSPAIPSASDTGPARTSSYNLSGGMLNVPGDNRLRRLGRQRPIEYFRRHGRTVRVASGGRWQRVPALGQRHAEPHRRLASTWGGWPGLHERTGHREPRRRHAGCHGEHLHQRIRSISPATTAIRRLTPGPTR